jgi:hypothetical protein
MNCDNVKCQYFERDIAMHLTIETKNFCHECTECGWFERVPRLSYEASVKQNLVDAQQGL